MKLYLVIVLLSICNAIVHGTTEWKGIIVNGAKYNLTIVQEGITDLRGMAALQKKLNEIFFTFSYFDIDHISGISHTARLTVDDRKFHILQHIQNSNTNYADNVNGLLYIGTTDGIYKLKPANLSIIEKMNITDNVISISTSYNDLYYVNDKYELYIYKNGESYKIRGLDQIKVKQIAINNVGKILFTTKDDVVGFATISNNGANNTAVYTMQGFRGLALAVDPTNDFYVSTLESLMGLDEETSTFTPVGKLSNLQGIIFEGNHRSIIYGINGYIVKLTQVEAAITSNSENHI